jgi:hypothetical protein
LKKSPLTVSGNAAHLVDLNLSGMAGKTQNREDAKARSVLVNEN